MSSYNRVEGQTWIDRNSPYRMKYYVHGQEYEVSVLQQYEASKALKAGDVVKVGSNGKLELAVFPRDIEKVIGVVAKDANKDDVVSVAESDNLYLNKDALGRFIGTEITKDNAASLIGAPVYWFIGRINTDYSYKDSSDEGCSGKLTLDTPAGFQWGKPSIDDDSLNVGYSNLPKLGNITDIEVENNEVKYAIINLHMSGFSLSQEWSWPLFYSKQVIEEGETKTKIVGLIDGYGDSSRKESKIIIRHGLFPNNESEELPSDDNHILVGRVRCFCDVIAMPSNEGSDTEYVVQAAVDNFIGHTEEQNADAHRRTEIRISTPETFRYSITGRVLYNFNKEVISSQDVPSNEPSNTEITEEENN